MDEGPVHKSEEPEDIAEDGLGAAYRGVILGYDGSNRYIAKL